MSLQERKIITRIYKSFFITHISFVNEKKKKKKELNAVFISRSSFILKLLNVSHYYFSVI